MTDLLFLVVVLPLTGAVINLFWGKRIGEKYSGWLALAFIAGAWLVAVPSTIGLINGSASTETVYLFSWIPAVGIDVAILWDPLSALLTMIVTGIGSLIHLYSIGYMRGDERYPRYFAFLNLFVASMMILVLAANYAVMFIGWELVGLSSYLLISFWFAKPSAAAAGKKAFVVNRIGDWGFLVAMMIIFAAFGTLDFGVVLSSAPGVLSVGAATAVTLLLFLAAAGKSAQIPLYIWLPDAMEGPTPVSALIHAATMVTAGIFMMARSAVLFEMAPASGVVVAVVGTATALVAAVIAMSQRDIKKVLAYSTVSQLGYMVLGIGVGAYSAGMFHLTTHAFFKALLFLGAGSVIHALGGEQDMRKMGGLRKKMPITFVTMVVGWLAISGMFPFSGFWSKDEILAATFARGQGFLVLWAIGLLVAVLTAWYMTRLIVMTFLGTPRWGENTHPHESPPTMTIPLIVLAVFTATIGGFNTPARLSFENFLDPSFEHISSADAQGLLLISVLAALTLALALGGLVLAWRRYHVAELPEEEGTIWEWSRSAFGVDDFYGRSVVAPLQSVSHVAATTVEPKVIDGVVHGVARTVRYLGAQLTRTQSGQVRQYAGGFVIAGIALVVVFLFLGGGF